MNQQQQLPLLTYSLTITGHTGRVAALRFHSPQSSSFGYLVTGGADSTVRLWNVLRQQQNNSNNNSALQLHVFKNGHPNGVEILDTCLEETAELLVSVGDARPVVVWDTTTGECITRFHGHEARVNTCIFKPKGIIITGSNDCSVRCWDVRARNQVAILPRFSDAVTSVCVYDSTIIVTSFGKLSMFDIRNGKQTVDTSPQALGCAKVSQDGKIVFVTRLSHNKASIHCIERVSGKTVNVLYGHLNQQLACKICLNDTGDELFAASEDGILRSWLWSSSTTTTTSQLVTKPKEYVLKKHQQQQQQRSSHSNNNDDDAILTIDHHPSNNILAYSTIQGHVGTIFTNKNNNT
jgi:WD40 repeat protein